ncbi:MAG: flagellar hook-basal body complex protein FliE [Desulfobacterales bacterium]|jgi:flagellar hook-basal body complex protein FliE|nr:flagellar hook-basal body complex protein FliE [Desulfobacterales bacterium]
MNEVTFQKGLESLTSTGTTARSNETAKSESFGSLLTHSLNEVNRLKLDADEAVNDLASGQQKDIHQTMIALEKADVAFQLLMQIRNKIVAAYESVMRMPV